ncbi:unnamed protein product [Withania somnifera]
MENKPLITVSNHVAAMDDPLVIAALLPPSVMLDAQNLRWTLCATDRCFRNPVTSAFFKHVKVLPVSRGDGIYQKGMDMAISKLNCGGWVHIFPEGSRSRDGGKTMGSVKRGIGRLVLDADNVPIVVPFVHTGMQDIMPLGAKLPRIGKTVTVIVGDPIEFDDLLAAGEKDNMPRGKLYDAVSTRIGVRLQLLKAQVDGLAVQEALQSQIYHDRIGEQAAGIVQHVDWEALGMDSYMSIEEDHVSPPRQKPSSEQLFVEKQVEENSQDRCFGLGFSRESGIMSRIRGYMDSTDLMLFSARCLVTSSRVKETFENIQEIDPLKAWNNFWMPLYESQVCNREILL